MGVRREEVMAVEEMQKDLHPSFFKIPGIYCDMCSKIAQSP